MCKNISHAFCRGAAAEEARREKEQLTHTHTHIHRQRRWEAILCTHTHTHTHHTHTHREAEEKAKLEREAEEQLMAKLKEAASEAGLTVEMGCSSGEDSASKFDSAGIVLGHPADAGRGIGPFVVGVDSEPVEAKVGDVTFQVDGENKLLMMAGGGMAAVTAVIKHKGSEADNWCMDYVLNQDAGGSTRRFQNGWWPDCKPDRVVVVESFTLEGGTVIQKGSTGKILENKKDGDTYPDPPSWGAAHIDFGGSIGEQWVSKDQFQNLAGEVLPERQVQPASGLKWLKCDTDPYDEGRQKQVLFLAHSELAKKLMHQTEFTQQEWDKFGIKNLCMEHRIRSDGLLGLQWIKTDTEPTADNILKNEPLADVLSKGKTEFTRQEWEDFGIQNLREGNCVKAGASFFKPTGFYFKPAEVDNTSDKRCMSFADFCALPIVLFCMLTEAEVFALRYYTTWGFVGINMPLRDQNRRQRKEPHKLAVLVFILAGAIKKLRAWAANSPNAHKPMDLFRGLSNRTFFSNFMKEGGTELSPMSTVSDSQSISSLLNVDDIITEMK